MTNPLYGARLKHIEPGPGDCQILHLQDINGRWHIFYTRRESRMKELAVYALCLLVVVGGVAVAVGLI